MRVTYLAECPTCGLKYKNPNQDHEGKKVICRCGAIFILESSPPFGRKGGCVYNLLTVEEDKEDWERAGSPCGIVRREFLEFLKSPDVLIAIVASINQVRRRPIDEDTVLDLIQHLEWEKEKDDESF